MKPTLIHQQGKSTCGQTCVAMVVGTTEFEVCEVLNSIKGTSTKDVQKALAHYGVTFEKRLRMATKADPMCARFKRAILCLKIRTDQNPRYSHDWHWMLSFDGDMYDPGGWWPGLRDGSRITSALVLIGRPGLAW